MKMNIGFRIRKCAATAAGKLITGYLGNKGSRMPMTGLLIVHSFEKRRLMQNQILLRTPWNANFSFTHPLSVV